MHDGWHGNRFVRNVFLYGKDEKDVVSGLTNGLAGIVKGAELGGQAGLLTGLAVLPARAYPKTAVSLALAYGLFKLLEHENLQSNQSIKNNQTALNK